jgi:hypothetical protein
MIVNSLQFVKNGWFADVTYAVKEVCCERKE